MRNANPYSALSTARRPQSQFRYPALMDAKAGRTPQTETDALGRALVRNSERPNDQGLRVPSFDGWSRPTGAGTYTEDIYAASQDEGADPFVNAQAPVGSPQSPGGIGGLSQADWQTLSPETQGRRSPSARQQAKVALRKDPSAFRGGL